MKPRLNATRAVRELIKAYEPFVETAERRGRRWVVGWGHRATAREGATLTRDNAELLLIYDALQAQDAVKGVVGDSLPKPARDALASFAASIGLGAFKVSDVARLAKAGRYREAAAALDSWVRTEVDGRLTVSAQLVERRRTEKTLFLDALDIEHEESGSAIEPMLGTLVDVDIAFEDEPAAPAEPPQIIPQPAAEGPEADPVELEDAAQPTAPAHEARPVSDDDARAFIEANGARPAFDAATAEPFEQATQTDARKSQQDAAIKSVMARMADDIATSVVPVSNVDDVEDRPADPADAPDTGEPAQDAADDAQAAPVQAEAEAEPDVEAAVETSDAPTPATEDLSDVQLGFSYMEPSRVEVPVRAPDAQSAPTPEPEPEPEPEPAPEPAPTPVYATVSVSTVPSKPVEAPEPKAVEADIPPAPVGEPAPPHPSLAPASAPGLSGESEGPDHPEDEEGDMGYEDDALDPAIVAGPEAADHHGEPAQQKEGRRMYVALLGVGGVLTGLGGWELASHWSAYSQLGLEFSPLGPVVFGAGVLLSVGAGWFVFRR
jgi:GH24 family phage-related lysozyme (muramidase)